MVGKDENSQFAGLSPSVQVASGAENSSSDSPLPSFFSNFDTALMSQGGSSPVIWLPIQAPQYIGRCAEAPEARVTEPSARQAARARRRVIWRRRIRMGPAADSSEAAGRDRRAAPAGTFYPGTGTVPEDSWEKLFGR